jgi:ATP-dependent exoDNAse (exonuclease V) beta subunit
MNTLFTDEITFEAEDHVYSLTEDPTFLFTSSTTFIHHFFTPFDQQKVAERLVTTKKYEGVDIEDLLADWKLSADTGTLVHDELETYILNKRKRPKHPKGKQGVKWLKDEMNKDWVLHPEVLIYSTEIAIAGMIDLLVYNPADDIYAIADWKTNKKIYTYPFGGKRGTRGSTADLADCNHIHYTLQLSLYRYILEEFYGLNVASTVLVHLREDEYKTYNLDYLKNSIIKMLADRDSNGLILS